MSSLVVNNAEQSAQYSVTDMQATSNEDNETSDNLDFIGSSSAVKSLFLLPYETSQSISVAVHNLRGTLLIDSDPGEQPLPSSRENRQKPYLLQANVNESSCQKLESEKDGEVFDSSTQSLVVAGTSYEGTREAMALLNSVMYSSNKQLDSDGSVTPTPAPESFANQYIPESPEPREYLSWKFHDMNMLIGSDALIYRATNDPHSTAITVRVEDASNMKALLKQHQQMVESGKFIVDHQFPNLNQAKKISYAEAVRKDFLIEQMPKDKVQEARSTESEQPSETSSTIDDDLHQVSSFSTPNFDNLQLQSCVVSSDVKDSVGSQLRKDHNSVFPESDARKAESSPVSTVLDTYLDNIMANVPQLALCLREKGFIQSVKLLETKAIPSRLMSSSTIDTSKPFEIISEASPEDEIFSPQIMEMNAATLLRFLKSNCNKDNATYLMRREAGQTNIQLYDISSISAHRQRKWLWWLSMISYRFAIRLRNIAANTKEKALRRNFRDRQRSLLQNTLDLLEAVADFNGSAHESLVAAVMENLADTFLCSTEEDEEEGANPPSKATSPIDSENIPKSPPPVNNVSSYQPYRKASADALHKAQDRLANGIKVLWPVLESKLNLSLGAKKNKRKDTEERLLKLIGEPTGSESDESSNDEGTDERRRSESKVASTEQIVPIATQLVGLHRKLIDVSLRLVEIHLKNYYSSSAMQSLRIAARRIADSFYLSNLCNENFQHNANDWNKHLQMQCIWLWEHCGHFARSFAADNLWRDRGHASGDDVISVLLDVEGAFLCRDLPIRCEQSSFLLQNSKGMLSLQELSGVIFVPSKVVQRIWNDEHRYSKEDNDTAICHAKDILQKQKTLQRDRRKVLVAACISYSIAIETFVDMSTSIDITATQELTFDRSLLELLYQRLGDACNEVGKMLLDELRILLKSLNETKCKDDFGIIATEPILVSAEFWFLEGLDAFQKSNDLRNVALLRCNLCQCYKLRANNTFAISSPIRSNSATKKAAASNGNSSHSEICLQESANHLLAAHESLGERHVDPVTWDMVSDELATTYLVLGVRRRQILIGSGNVPMASPELRLTHGKERSIIEPMERSLAIYEQMGNFHQAAAANYQLALFYSKIWTCQRDEVKTREKLGSAFKHYYSAFTYFSRSIQGNEATLCLLCLDLSSLYSIVSGKEGLTKAIKCCLDTADAFSDESIEMASSNLVTRAEWFEKMETISKTIEEKVFKLLRSLIKLEEDGNVSADESIIYKDLYRVGLQAKLKSASANTLIPISDTQLMKQANELSQLRYILKEISSRIPPTW